MEDCQVALTWVLEKRPLYPFISSLSDVLDPSPGKNFKEIGGELEHEFLGTTVASVVAALAFMEE